MMNYKTALWSKTNLSTIFVQFLLFRFLQFNLKMRSCLLEGQHGFPKLIQL